MRVVHHARASSTERLGCDSRRLFGSGMLRRAILPWRLICTARRTPQPVLTRRKTTMYASLWHHVREPMEGDLFRARSGGNREPRRTDLKLIQYAELDR